MSENDFAQLPPKPRLRPAEIAQYLDVSLATIYVLIADGVLPAQKVGRQYRIPRDEFLRWDAARCDSVYA